jgi:hypothetical protein
MTRGALLALAAGVTVSALLALTACLPSVHINDPMPMSIHRDALGALTVSFPVCGGDRVYSVAVGADGADGPVALRYGPAPERQEESSIETFVVDDASVAADRLDVPWPVNEMWPNGTLRSLSDITSVWVTTTTRAAGADLAALLPGGPGDWLVTGDRIEHDALPVATSAQDAKAVVEAFCEGS